MLVGKLSKTNLPYWKYNGEADKSTKTGEIAKDENYLYYEREEALL